MPNCTCVVKNRQENESQREWFKRWMCMWHWMETDYYQNKLETNRFTGELRLHLADSTPEHGLEEYSEHCDCDFCRGFFKSRQDTRVP